MISRLENAYMEKPMQANKIVKVTIGIDMLRLLAKVSNIMIFDPKFPLVYKIWFLIGEFVYLARTFYLISNTERDIK
jgi:hypothetical protein